MLCLIAKLFIVSTRDINAGEEIFYSYGFNYWRGRISMVNENY